VCFVLEEIVLEMRAEMDSFSCLGDSSGAESRLTGAESCRTGTGTGTGTDAGTGNELGGVVVTTGDAGRLDRSVMLDATCLSVPNFFDDFVGLVIV
jgi:hypothetical protein